MGNLADTIINQVIGALIGTLVSFAVSWYFYKKADFPSKVAGEMIENVLAAIIQGKLGDHFNFVELPPKDELPKDRDIPHITQFWFTEKTPKQGQSVLALFRVEDLGMDFGRPANAPETEIRPNIVVTDTSSMKNLPVTREGHAYYSCKVDFPDDAVLGQHTVTFKLTDHKGKSHTQSVKFDVVPRFSQ